MDVAANKWDMPTCGLDSVYLSRRAVSAETHPERGETRAPSEQQVLRFTQNKKSKQKARSGIARQVGIPHNQTSKSHKCDYQVLL
jgi:hypothetical protein